MAAISSTTKRNQWDYLSLIIKTEEHKPLLCSFVVPQTKTGRDRCAGCFFPCVNLSMAAQNLCQLALCDCTHTEGSHTAQAAPAVCKGGRKGAIWSLGREGQATTENTSSDPILRPLSPGLGCAGCQPLITLSAPEMSLVPITPSLLDRAGPTEPRHR